jgi:urease accessory protein
MKTKSNALLLTALVLAAVHSASAHPGLVPATGFASGLIHPFTGWDHLVAMVAVGFWAAQMRAPRLLPIAFLAAMTLGAVVGRWTGPIDGVQQGIAVSVLVVGLLIASGVRIQAAMGAVCVGVFAIFHGAAHGAEMPASVGALSYGLGFIVATALLLAAGVASGNLTAQLPARLSRAPGWVVVAAGLALSLGLKP